MIDYDIIYLRIYLRMILRTKVFWISNRLAHFYADNLLYEGKILSYHNNIISPLTLELKVPLI